MSRKKYLKTGKKDFSGENKLKQKIEKIFTEYTLLYL